jgi:threonine dehydratase
MDKYVKKILEANVYDVATETPLDYAPLLSKRFGSKIFLKREDLQPVFSFKVRGAYNKIRLLSEDERARGVITASAGNHAQGVALAASTLGIRSTIVMGENTPSIKVNAVSSLGAKVILAGDSYDQAAKVARELGKKEGLSYIHPFDDEDVIAGQGTIGMEMLRQHTGSLDAIFVPVGGGGLISGIGSYVKYLRPEVRIIGVEAEGSACLWEALDKGRRVTLSAKDLDQFADGTAVRQVGKITYKIARRCVDEVIKVSVDEICAAIKDIFEENRVISEPSGALAVAGLKKYLNRGSLKETLFAVVSGANVNFDRLRHISERTEIGEKREMLLSVSIPEEPGSFQRFCKAIGKLSITEFNYRYGGKSHARVLVGIQISGSKAEQRSSSQARLLEKLSKQYEITDLSSNEVAVLHIRHMVGGRASGVSDERIFRFEFPEKPGALLKFLEALGGRYNISMFHYRNHGAAYGRVLVGIQIPRQDESNFMKKMKLIAYRFWDETDNPAYQQFLAE